MSNKEKETTVQNDKPELITISEKVYFLDSIDEESKKIISDIKTIEVELSKLQTKMDINNIARTTLYNILNKNEENFKEYKTEEK